MKRKLIAFLLSFSLLLGLSFGSSPVVYAGTVNDLSLSVQSTDQTQMPVTFINPEFTINGGTDVFRDSISLFTYGNTPYVNEKSINTNVAVVIDSDSIVTRVINQSVNGAKPAFNEATNVEVPEGGCVLLACDSSYAAAGYKLFLATKFNVGDTVTFYNNEDPITLAEVLASLEEEPNPSETPSITPSASLTETPSISPSPIVTITPQVSGTPTQIPSASEFSYTLEGLTVETAFDPNFTSAGETKTIDFVNPDFTGPVTFCNSISIFTEGNRPYVSDGAIKTNVAVVVDKNMTVLQVINASVNGQKPSFTESTDVTVPEGGFVLLACDDSYASAGYKQFLATKFNAGDQIKLKVNGTEMTVEQILKLAGQTGESIQHAKLKVTNQQMVTVTDPEYVIRGIVTNMQEGMIYDINVVLLSDGQSYFTQVAADGSFEIPMMIEQGTNYYDVTLVENGVPYEESTQSVIAYRRDIASEGEKPIILWIDEFASAKNLNSVAKIEKMVKNAKEAGVTAFAFDVKGCEGYVAYKKATVSNRAYMTETTNPNKAVSMEIDFLEEMLKAAHANGIKLYTSFNFFAEGNVSMKDSAADVFGTNRDWAEVLQAPEDKGEIKSMLDSSHSSTLVYVNPGNPDVQKEELALVEDVLANYEIDGIIMDRARYDNQYADFSDLSKMQFTDYLNQKGKQLVTWPDDVYKIQSDGSMVTGQHYLEWLSYRSQVIADFVADLKELVEQYETQTGRNISLAAYVGAWYESYYQNGVNWADDSFVYNERLQFPLEELYDSEFGYGNTSYLNSIDFIMTGCYYTNTADMMKYATLSNILVNEQVPVYASIDLTNLKEAALQRDIFQAAYQNSDGSMIFDLCFVDWDMIGCAIADKEYVNTVTIGVYDPLTKDSLCVDAIDTSRAEDKITMYTPEFGEYTGTNQWGVEIAVDGTGTVVETKNQAQAVNWNWSTTEQNNCAIPEGGFVLSTVDKSGSRTYRQLLANTFALEDVTAAAILRGYGAYEVNTVTQSTLLITVQIDVLGKKDNVTVTMNGVKATAADNMYSATVTLHQGVNQILIEVSSDDMKVLKKEITVNANIESAGPTPAPVPETTQPDTTNDDQKKEEEAKDKRKKEQEELELMIGQITLEETELELYAGGNSQNEAWLCPQIPDTLKAYANEKNAGLTVKYSVSDPEVITMLRCGKVIAKKEGTVIVTTDFRLNNQSIKTLATEIIVKKASIVIVLDEQEIKAGSTVEAECIAKGYDLTKIHWMTSRRKIAVVSKNVGKAKVVITGQSAGKDRVYVYFTGDKGKRAQAYATIKVVKKN